MVMVGFLIISEYESEYKCLDRNVLKKELQLQNVEKISPSKLGNNEREKNISENIKLWISNAGNFFGDIFTKGAIKVYSEPVDSINLK